MDLSVITISYNDPASLERSLLSVLPLAGSPIAWEHILVDSSPAQNRSLRMTYADRLPLNVVETEPLGIYPAMNAGLAKARGDLVWFLNGGDELISAPALREAMSTLLEDPSADMVIAAAELRRAGFATYVRHPRAGIAPMLGINRVCHQSVLYRRSLLTRLGGFSEKYRLASDYELHLRAHHTGAKALTLDRPIVAYDMEGQSSNADRVFAEFRQIHRDLTQAKQLPHALAHKVAWGFERSRACALQAVLSSRAGPALRRVWRKFRRCLD